MEKGIHSNKEWYPDLTPESTFSEFQKTLHSGGRSGCPMPCNSKGGIEIDESCHTATDKDADATCYKAIMWAKKGGGLAQNPHWYPGLHLGSMTEEFQAHLHKNSGANCPKPCKASDAAVQSKDGGVNIRLMTFNVFWIKVWKRSSELAKTVAAISPDVGVITELWQDKWLLMKHIKEQSGRNYVLCNGGAQEKSWDGDVFYDADIWRRNDDGVHLLGNERGLSWASLQHIKTGKKMLVYGFHPIRPYNEGPHLENAMQVGKHMRERPELADAPVVMMGDFNAHMGWPSMRCYRGEEVHAEGRYCKLPLKFVESHQDTENNWGDITHKQAGFIDHILLEKREPAVFETLSSAIWDSPPGRSDHNPLFADVILK